MSTNCAICEKPLAFRWSDTHGIGACTTCGLPYRIYHYENDQRVEKPPSIAIDEAWLPLGRKYWAETHRRTFPAAFDFMRGRGGRSYSGASEDECEEFHAWMEARRDEWPVRPDEALTAAD